VVVSDQEGREMDPVELYRLAEDESRNASVWDRAP
jgi:hypothetical protein